MIKIIHRYILKEIILSFIFGFLFFNFILFIGIIFDLTELLFVENISFLDVGKLLLFKLPSSFDIVIPLSLLFASLLTFGRLSSDGEIIAFISSGISLLRIERTLLIFAFILSMVSLYFSSFLTPWCNRHYSQVFQEIIFKEPTIQIKERTITDFENRKLYTHHIDSKTGKMQKIILYEFLPQKDYLFPQIVIAQKGEFEKKNLRLEGITFYLFGKNYRILRQGEFNSQTIYSASQLLKRREEIKRTGELSLTEISQKLKEEKAKEKLDKEKIKELAVEFHGRIAIPLATFLLALIALPLGISIKRGEKSISLGISLIIAIIYYVLFLAGRFLGKGGLLPPYLAMWMPNLLLGIACIWLTRKATKI